MSGSLITHPTSLGAAKLLNRSGAIEGLLSSQPDGEILTVAPTCPIAASAAVALVQFPVVAVTVTDSA
jgi:hypothetical protein